MLKNPSQRQLLRVVHYIPFQETQQSRNFWIKTLQRFFYYLKALDSCSRLLPSLGWVVCSIGLVALVEQTLKKVLGISLVSRADLETIITESDAAVNSRRITYVEETVSLTDEALTPSHLIHGGQINTVPHYGRSGYPDFVQSKHTQLTQRMKYRNSFIGTVDRIFKLLKEKSNLQE